MRERREKGKEEGRKQERKGGRERFLGRIRGEFPEENVVGDSRQSVGGFIFFFMKKNCLFSLIKLKEN